jgi:dihydrofolate reductase
MRRVFLYMTTTLDGCVAGPNNELDWMTQTPDDEIVSDVVSILSAADTGLMGYPTGAGMIPYWRGVQNDPAAPPALLEIGRAVNRANRILLSKTEERVEWENTELVLVRNDDDLVRALAEIRRRPGKDIGVPGGVRTAQTLSRLGVIDEYIFMVHPVVLGNGKRIFSSKAGLELKSVKAYRSGVMQVRYQPVHLALQAA